MYGILLSDLATAHSADPFLAGFSSTLVETRRPPDCRNSPCPQYQYGAGRVYY